MCMHAQIEESVEHLVFLQRTYVQFTALRPDFATAYSSSPMTDLTSLFASFRHLHARDAETYTQRHIHTTQL